MQSYCGKIPTLGGLGRRARLLPLEQQPWAPGFDPVSASREKSRFAFGRPSRCGTEVARKLAAHRGVPALPLEKQPCPDARSVVRPVARSVEQQRLSSDQVPLFEPMPRFELQKRARRSAQPGTVWGLRTRVRSGRAQQREKTGKRGGPEKPIPRAECIGRHIMLSTIYG